MVSELRLADLLAMGYVADANACVLFDHLQRA